MKHTFRLLTGSAAALAFVAFSAPASAQKIAAGGGGGGGEKVSAPSAPASSGGGDTSMGSSGGSSGGYSGGGYSGGGGGPYLKGGDSSRRSGATGGSSYVAPHSPRATDSNRGPGMNAVSGGSGRQRTGEPAARTNLTPGSPTSGSDGVPAYSRPSTGNQPVGTAVPRGTTPQPPSGGGGVIWYPGGYYPGYGYGYGGYYGSYGAYYDPLGYYGGGMYGAYYDPWYGGVPSSGEATFESSSSSDEGSLRLKIKPNNAEVYVDGYYVGVVDDFDGMFQRLHLDSGAHRIEVRAAGYETLDFDVRITSEHTTTYQGELKKIQ